MAIKINHRFIERLTSTDGYSSIDTIIIGTFNPGLPNIASLNETELRQFEEIKNSKKFKKFNEVKNFYDRPQNRFWKVMDYINDSNFYSRNNIKSKNCDGLKFYSGMDRGDVFKKQLHFCRQKGILITDIARSINPISFCDIYDNFPDTAIERASPIWNTDDIINLIQERKPKKILINFKANSKSTPNICSEISKIINYFPDITILSLKSTSGAAGYEYTELIDDWAQHF